MNIGWECPRCGKIHAPHIDSCDCSKPGEWAPNQWPTYPTYPWYPYNPVWYPSCGTTAVAYTHQEADK